MKIYMPTAEPTHEGEINLKPNLLVNHAPQAFELQVSEQSVWWIAPLCGGDAAKARLRTSVAAVEAMWQRNWLKPQFLLLLRGDGTICPHAKLSYLRSRCPLHLWYVGVGCVLSTFVFSCHETRTSAAHSSTSLRKTANAMWRFLCYWV